VKRPRERSPTRNPTVTIRIFIAVCRAGSAAVNAIALAGVVLQVAAIDKYGDLMRMAIATPGNDFRLGGMEAPPAVISTCVHCRPPLRTRHLTLPRRCRMSDHTWRTVCPELLGRSCWYRTCPRASTGS
jgi:hypothetical protein